MICKKCGTENSDDSVFCQSCGEKLSGVVNNNTYADAQNGRKIITATHMLSLFIIKAVTVNR